METFKLTVRVLVSIVLLATFTVALGYQLWQHGYVGDCLLGVLPAFMAGWTQRVSRNAHQHNNHYEHLVLTTYVLIVLAFLSDLVGVFKNHTTGGNKTLGMFLWLGVYLIMGAIGFMFHRVIRQTRVSPLLTNDDLSILWDQKGSGSSEKHE